MEEPNQKVRLNMSDVVNDINSHSPKRSNQSASIESKMLNMRERFKNLKLEEEDDVGKTSEENSVLSPLVSATNHPPSATNRWSLLRKVVRKDSVDMSASNLSLFTPREAQTPHSNVSSTEQNEGAIELEDIELMKFWENTNIDNFNPDEAALNSIVPLPIETTAEGDFEAQYLPVNVEVSRIPEEVVAEQKEKIQLSLYEEQTKIIDNIKRKEVDVIWREHLARERLAALEAESKTRLETERDKLVELSRQRDVLLGQDFRKVREELEAGLKRQQGAVKENFGQMVSHEESIARRFHVFSKLLPQPIEIRIHLLRAVKTKLRKGAYVMMLTQYDALGGRPLTWSQIGVNGIGSLRPGLTKVFKHYGRYFDRTLRVEDSCYALCPPRPYLKPSFVFVLELFELASRHNPTDRIVGWSAVPMSYESMSLIEGKIKLPFLQGEHSPAIQHFREMENSMAHNLNNWLCNGYIEVRHMSLDELGADEAMLKSTDYDLDYFNKLLASNEERGETQSTKKAHSRQASFFGGGSTPRSPTASGRVVTSPGVSGRQQGVISQSASARVQSVKSDANQDGDDDEDHVDIEGGGGGGGETNITRLTVDKGIFRRKAPQQLLTIAASNATTSGGGSGADIDLEGGSNGGPQGGEQNDDDHGDSSPLLTGQRGEDSRSNSIKQGGVFSGVLGFFGAKSARDNGKHRSVIHTSVLQRDESFVAHRNALVTQWKNNIKSKLPHSPTGHFSDDDLPLDEVRERGYNLQDEVFLHRQQRGKLAGVEAIDSQNGRSWAAAGLEGTIVRRWQSDGPRFDSEAISAAEEVRSAAVSGKVLNHSASKAPTLGMNKTADPDEGWQELRDSREMEDYSMSIASDPSRRKNLIPGATARTKIRYLSMELFGDLAPRLFGTFDFYVTAFMFLFTFWIRLYVHYLAQYLYLQSLGTPIFGFRMEVLLVSFKYMSESISTAGEVGVVAIGPIANICVFLFVVVSGALFYKFAKFLPEVVSKFLAAYGVATICDPLLTLLVDLGYHNYHCTVVSDACHVNYVSRDCDCFNGDFIKLWYRMLRIEGSGITGLFIMLLLYIGSAVLSSLILYEYLVHLHRDGRILDIWRRINAPAEEFFLPHDYEISSEELNSICGKAVRWKGLLGAKRKVVTVEGIERDPNDRNFMGRFKRFIIYEVEANGRNSVYRQFLLDASGVILEIFEDVKRANQQRHLFGDMNAASSAGPPKIIAGLQDAVSSGAISRDDGEEKDSDDGLLSGGEPSLPAPMLRSDKVSQRK